MEGDVHHSEPWGCCEYRVSTQQGCASEDPVTFTPSSHNHKALLALSEYNIQNNPMFVVRPEPWPLLQDVFCKPRTKRQSLPRRICNLKHQHPVVKAIKWSRQGSDCAIQSRIAFPWNCFKWSWWDSL